MSNPYQILFNWLLDKSNNYEVPKEVLNLPAKYILLNFMNNKKMVDIINSYLNDNHIHLLSNELIFQTIKYMCNKFGLRKDNIMFINKTLIEKHEMLDKIKHKLPNLKPYEIEYLLENYYESEEMQTVLNSCALLDKIKKPTKKKKEKAIKFKNIIDKFKNIKQNNKNCKNCELYNNPIVLFDSNSKNNIRNIDILWIAEAPGKTEVEKGVPLIGRSGQKLRQFIKKYIDKNNLKWFMTNTCLCRPNNNETPNPNMRLCCIDKLHEIIETTNPKLIVLLGSTPLYNFGFNDLKISKCNGQLLEWKHNNKSYNIIPLLHPSAIIRNAFPESKYDEGFNNIINFFNKSNNDNINIKETKGNIVKEYLKFDSDMLNKYLIDVFKVKDDVYYIFKDKDNNKTIKKYPYENFYYWTSNKNNIIINQEDAIFHRLHYKEYRKNKESGIHYESDVPMEMKHTLELLSKTKVDHIEYNPSILYLDIEVFRDGYLGFPEPDKAKYPINAISYWYDNKYYNLTLKPKNCKYSEKDLLSNISKDIHVKEIVNKVKDNLEIKFFDNEKQLIDYFIKDINKKFPDVLTAWNISFDIGYIYNRMKKLGMNPNNLSPLKHVEVDVKRNYIVISGYIILDMLTLYKGFTFESKESYSLSFIAKEELDDDKIQYEENLDKLYLEDLQKFIFYNIKDVDLILGINNKLKHIELVNLIRLIAKTTWSKALSTSGPIDNLFINKLHNDNMICRNYMSEYKINEEVPGAYVKLPKGGIYKYVIDLDFSSLYPNLMRTYNIGPDTLVGVIDEKIAIDFIYDKDNFTKKYQDIEIITDTFIGCKRQKINSKSFLDWSKDKIITISGTIYIKHEKKKSMTYEIITELITNRKKYKKLMLEAIEENNKQKRETYYNYQYALKVLANSIYGALGFDKIRWYNPYMAKSITLSGREASKISAIFCDQFLDNSINIEKGIRKFIDEYHNQDIDTKYVLYMDTDSLFVNLEKFIDNKKKEKDNVDFLVKNIIPNLQDYLNIDVLKNLLVKLHNVDDNNCFLDLKQEIICKTILFLHEVKKRYAAWIIYKEGKSVQEDEIKGLDTKRSDYPKLTKEKLEYLIKDLILLPDKINISKIKNFIKETENEFLELIRNGDIRLSRPVSFSKNLDEYKNLPQHIKGMLIWNKLEYECFLPGTKGYLYKLKGLDLQKAPKHIVDNYFKNLDNSLKIDVIVVPQDIKQVPSYYIIDTNHMIKFAWLDRINLLLGDMIKTYDMKKEGRQIATF